MANGLLNGNYTDLLQTNQNINNLLGSMSQFQPTFNQSMQNINYDLLSGMQTPNQQQGNLGSTFTQIGGGLGVAGLAGSALTQTDISGLGGLKNFRRTIERKIRDIESDRFSTAQGDVQQAFGQLEGRAAQGLEQVQRATSMRGLQSSGIAPAMEQQQQFDVARAKGNITAQLQQQQEQQQQAQLQNLYQMLGQTEQQIGQMEFQQDLSEQQRKANLFQQLGGLAGSFLQTGLLMMG